MPSLGRISSRSTMYYYMAIERFDPSNGERWLGYTRWLGRTDLTRVVTLDSILCPPVVHVESSEDWPFVARGCGKTHFSTIPSICSIHQNAS
jgi:hypothetical protein